LELPDIILLIINKIKIMITPKEQELINFVHKLNNPWFLALFVAIAVWTIIWKGVALWKAVKNNSMPWYVVLLLVNTLGILEIIYIFFFSKKKAQQ